MSEASDDPDEDVEESVDPAGPDDPEGPDLEDDDLVDVDEEMAAQVSESTTSSSDEADDQEDGAGDQDDAGDESSPSPTETLTTGTSVGDLYCNALGMGATLARESKGSGVDDREDSMEEYGDLARQLELDEFVNEWVEQHGAADELTPAQGIAVGTGMFAMMVMVEDPEIAENLGQEVGA